jgi:hypothetical protein
MKMLMALLLAAAGGEDADGALPYRDLDLPLTLASEEPQNDPDPERRRQVDSDRPKWNLGLELSGHYSFPFGYANRDIIYIDNPAGGLTLVVDSTLQWREVFSSGWGTTLTAEINLIQAGRGSGSSGRGRSKYSAGAYLSISQDHFTGNNVSDGHGNKLLVDDMEMNTYMVGLTSFQDMGQGAFVDGRFGLGAVHYSKVDADFIFVLNQPFRATFLDDTWNLALEVRGGGGYRFGALGIHLGLGMKMLLPPNQGPTLTLDSGILWTFDIDLGIEINF